MTIGNDRQVTGRICIALAVVLFGTTSVPQVLAQSNDRSEFIDGIAVGSNWQDVTSNEGNNLRVDYQTIAYSGGGTANGRTVLFGGGHNNGMSDAVAFLDWRNFESVGWVEEFPSTADHIGVADDNWAAIGQYLNDNYSGATPGGISDSRGLVALSRHTYDQMAVLDDRFYLFGGALPWDNPGQPGVPWRTPDEGDIWRYDFGAGWTYISRDITRGWPGHGAAAVDSLTGDIWVHDDTGVRRFDIETETLGAPIGSMTSQTVESMMNFNSEKGSQGTLFGSGTYAGPNWQEFDIATGQQRNMGPVPGDASTTYIVYVDSSFGPNYGTYFAFVPADGTLRRWNGDGWDTIATGAPRGGYLWGRAGFEPVHEVFYWITNDYSGNDSWKTYVVRPFPFAGTAVPAPTVTLTANPVIVEALGSTTLDWSSSNATSCTASGAWSGSKSMSGSQMITGIDGDSTYSLTCSGAGGTRADSVLVTVQGASAPPTVVINANPTNVDSGNFSTVDWTSSNANTCSALGDWSGTKPLQGSESVGPLTADAQFQISCTGPGGEGVASVTVTVSAASPPPGGSNPGGDDSAPVENGGGGFGYPFLLLLLACGLLRLQVRRTSR